MVRAGRFGAGIFNSRIQSGSTFQGSGSRWIYPYLHTTNQPRCCGGRSASCLQGELTIKKGQIEDTGNKSNVKIYKNIRMDGMKIQWEPEISTYRDTKKRTSISLHVFTESKKRKVKRE